MVSDPLIRGLVILVFLAVVFGVMLWRANRRLNEFIRRENERDGLDPQGRSL